MFKVIIAGGRDFDNFEMLKEHCDQKLFLLHPNIQVVSGRCSSGVHTFTTKDGIKVYGADGLGEKYAELRGYEVMPFPADWKEWGRQAGPKRNEQMANVGDGAILYWDGISPGTKDMHKRALKHKMKVSIKKYKLKRPSN